MNARRQNPPLVRYAFAVLSVGILFWFELATWPLFRVTPFLPLAAGVVLTACLAGPASSQAGRTPEELVGSGIAAVFPHAAEPPILDGVRLAVSEGIPGRYETFD